METLLHTTNTKSYNYAVSSDVIVWFLRVTARFYSAPQS